MIPSCGPFPKFPMTDPLPSCYRPPSPPTTLSTQPPCTQLTMYRHLQYINYYKQQQLIHEAEMRKYEALHQQAVMSSSPPCYVRNFSSPMSVTPPGSPQDKFIFPEKVYDTKEVKFGNQEQTELQQNVKELEAVDKPSVDILGNMLAELREGTMAVDM